MIDPRAVQSQERRNALHSALLLGAMGALLLAIGASLPGVSGTWLVAIGVVIALLFGPRLSPRVVLRLYRARPLRPRELPELHEVLAALAGRAGLSRAPLLYYVPSAIPNAFSVGCRDDAAVAVSDGLLRRLGFRELVGVLAHETAHVRHDDVTVMTLADLISRVTAALTTFGQILVLLYLPALAMGAVEIPLTTLLLLLFGPMLMTLLQLALSRTREFSADLGAVQMTGDPLGLASALEKIERDERGWLETILLPGRRNPEASVFRTHPATEQRIERLLEMSRRPEELPRESLRPAPARFTVPPELGAVARRPRWHVLDLWY